MSKILALTIILTSYITTTYAKCIQNDSKALTVNKIYLSNSKYSVSKLISEIEKQSNAKISYQSEMVDTIYQKIAIRKGYYTVSELLEALNGLGIGHKTLSDNIVLVKEEHAPMLTEQKGETGNSSLAIPADGYFTLSDEKVVADRKILHEQESMLLGRVSKSLFSGGAKCNLPNKLLTIQMLQQPKRGGNGISISKADFSVSMAPLPALSFIKKIGLSIDPIYEYQENQQPQVTRQKSLFTTWQMLDSITVDNKKAAARKAINSEQLLQEHNYSTKYSSHPFFIIFSPNRKGKVGCNFALGGWFNSLLVKESYSGLWPISRNMMDGQISSSYSFNLGMHLGVDLNLYQSFQLKLCGLLYANDSKAYSSNSSNLRLDLKFIKTF